MNLLFTPLTIGNYPLKNRIIMAPLTRGRAIDNGAPNVLMAEYYAQRASAGLIIAEATAVSRDGLGWLNSPGIYTDQQQQGWKQVADAVHREDGRIFVQLWHMGSAVHPDFLNGELPFSSSAVKQQGALKTPRGRNREFVIPQALTKPEISRIVGDFAEAARKAIEAGLDGVEIHAANGFLIDQFTRDSVNQRDDEYGGSVENRLRFMLEVVDAVCEKIGSDKVGIRLSPTNSVWGIKDSNPSETFITAVKKLNEYNLAYLHVLEPKPSDGSLYLTPEMRKHYQGHLLINGAYTKESANNALENKEGDAVTFGNPFIANPDLVNRFKAGAELVMPDSDTFYTDSAKGYTDYLPMEV
jgi:N-ethylmaleimide reductase